MLVADWSRGSIKMVGVHAGGCVFSTMSYEDPVKRREKGDGGLRVVLTPLTGPVYETSLHRLQRRNAEKVQEAKRRRLERNKKWKKANPQKVKEQKKRWRERNPEKVQEQKDRWRKANPEKVKECRKRYRERENARLEIDEERLRETRKKARERKQRWRKAYPEKVKEYRKRYRKAHQRKCMHLEKKEAKRHERLLGKEIVNTIRGIKNDCVRSRERTGGTIRRNTPWLRESGERKTERLRTKGHANTIVPIRNNATRLGESGVQSKKGVPFHGCRYHRDHHNHPVTVGCALPAGDGLCHHHHPVTVGCALPGGDGL